MIKRKRRAARRQPGASLTLLPFKQDTYDGMNKTYTRHLHIYMKENRVTINMRWQFSNVPPNFGLNFHRHSKSSQIMVFYVMCASKKNVAVDRAQDFRASQLLLNFLPPREGPVVGRKRMVNQSKNGRGIQETVQHPENWADKDRIDFLVVRNVVVLESGERERERERNVERLAENARQALKGLKGSAWFWLIIKGKYSSDWAVMDSEMVQNRLGSQRMMRKIASSWLTSSRIW